ncbi:aminoglycoside phosphotransferase family protein [Eubacteriales bacterium OttesenSCG-928-A19]|nr:aminoglycoside phosphotransferase family protein [Eubacteriales bacterium OttesenSCG-928-A19]
MKKMILDMLQSHYAITPYALIEMEGGWSASAYKAVTEKGSRFVKVYDKHRPSIQSWIERTEAYMPIVLWLHEHTALRDKMIAPLLTEDGAYKVEDDDFLFIAFPFLDGASLCESPLSASQAHQLAEILATLHSYNDSIPVPTKDIMEDFSLPFFDKLSSYVALQGTPSAIAATLDHYADSILAAMETLAPLSDQLRSAQIPLVLCHTDVHGWNLMQTAGGLVLIDWEGLRLAPAEADLFSFTDGFFFDDASEAFFAAYAAFRPEYSVDKSVMDFYRLRRRLEDIEAFADSLLHDSLSAEEVSRSLYHLEKECSFLPPHKRP